MMVFVMSQGVPFTALWGCGRGDTEGGVQQRNFQLNSNNNNSKAAKKPEAWSDGAGRQLGNRQAVAPLQTAAGNLARSSPVFGHAAPGKHLPKGKRKPCGMGRDGAGGSTPVSPALQPPPGL